MRDFKKYTSWQDAFQSVKTAYELSNKLPGSEKFGLASQMSRAADSIRSNIAEGCSRNSDLEFKRFLEIALGSSFKLESQLLLCTETELLPKAEVAPLIEKSHQNQASINSLIQKIKSTDSKPQRLKASCQ